MSKHYTDEDIERGADAVFSIGWPLGSGPSCKQSSEAVLDAVAPAIAARALREFAEQYAAYANDTYWRDDSAFHAEGRFHGGLAAEWLNDRADAIEATS